MTEQLVIQRSKVVKATGVKNEINIEVDILYPKGQNPSVILLKRIETQLSRLIKDAISSGKDEIWEIIDGIQYFNNDRDMEHFGVIIDECQKSKIEDLIGPDHRKMVIQVVIKGCNDPKKMVA